jgi:hypothetical protein
MRAANRGLRDPVRDVLQHVEPCHALRREQLRCECLRLLQDCRADISSLHFRALRALDMEHRGLQDAAERCRLLRLPLLATLLLFDRIVEIRVQVAPQPRQIGAARREDPFAVGVVRERVEQMLEGHVRVTPRNGLAVGDGQNNFDRGGKHCSAHASSIVARRGNSA